MKNLMTIALIAISLTSLAACNNKLETADFGSEGDFVQKSAMPAPNNKLTGKLVRLVYLHSGWYRAPGSSWGNRIELNFRADLGLVEFSQYELTDAQPEGEIRCSRTFVNPAHYTEIKTHSTQLYVGASEGSYAIDIGTFEIEITDSNGYTLSGILNASDRLRAGQTSILNAEALSTKILQLSQECKQGQGLKAVPVPTK